MLQRSTAAAGLTDVSLEGIEVALTHASYAHEAGRTCPHNERLEFLGDAVLGLCVADELFGNHPDLGPGEMTKLRAAVVSGEALADVARAWRLGPELRLGHGEDADGGRTKDSNLSRAVEAVFGALYLKLGYERTRSLVRQVLGPRIVAATEETGDHDFKSALQEQAQAVGLSPRYQVVSRQGPDHAPRWTVRVTVGELVAEGEGSSKRLAERAAAGGLLDLFSPEQGNRGTDGL